MVNRNPESRQREDKPLPARINGELYTTERVTLQKRYRPESRQRVDERMSSNVCVCEMCEVCVFRRFAVDFVRHFVIGAA